MDNPKFFGAFVNGILRNTFYGDESITPEFLKTELFADHDITVEDIAVKFKSLQELLTKAGSENYEISEVEKALQSTDLDEMQQAVVAKLWRTQRQKIHDSLRQKSSFNDKLKKLSWRIDVETKTKDSKGDLNNTIAIVEMVLGKPSFAADSNTQTVSETDKAIRFEMSKDQIHETLYHINNIQKLINGDQEQQ
eukprot:TRINITY_DN8974_c0_g1_i1.p1 TRINITY_DN8974_c0_g1~~TRINITY_DN8974_c0_g1_i1.p1  ORF type:complete len:194 (-),score=49.60 TRINITY_DN8974_c0_g1_i1:43-624(-)